MLEYTLKIKLISDGNRDVKLSTESNLEGKPSIYFARFILAFQDLVQNGLPSHGELSAKIAGLEESIINCDCNEDE